MPTHNDQDPSTITCTRCGKCCLSVYVPVTEKDMEIWKQEGKTDILRAMEHAKPVWAGDIIVCSENGKMLFTCPFLRYEGRHCTCTIYEDRPITCRNYLPGSSSLCPQYKGL